MWTVDEAPAVSTLFFLRFFDNFHNDGRLLSTSTGVGVTGVEILGRVGVRTIGTTKSANTQRVCLRSFAVGVKAMGKGVF